MDDFDPEMMREFQENLNSLSSTMGGMSTAFEDLVTTIKTVAKTQDDSSKAFQNSMKNNTSAIEDFTKTTTELGKANQEATKDVTEEYLKKLDELRNDDAKNKNPADSHDDVMVY